MTHKPKPETVEPGQRWRDLDQRTRHEELTVVAVVTADGIRYREGEEPDPQLAEMVEDLLPRVVGPEETDYAVVERGSGGITFHRVIKIARLLGDDATRGYEYLGMDR